MLIKYVASGLLSGCCKCCGQCKQPHKPVCLNMCQPTLECIQSCRLVTWSWIYLLFYCMSYMHIDIMFLFWKKVSTQKLCLYAANTLPHIAVSIQCLIKFSTACCKGCAYTKQQKSTNTPGVAVCFYRVLPHGTAHKPCTTAAFTQ